MVYTYPKDGHIYLLNLIDTPVSIGCTYMLVN